MTAPAFSVPASRVHGGHFPHAADCRQCWHERRCPNCGQSKGSGSRASARHGYGKCETPAHRAWRAEREAEQLQERAAAWLAARIQATRDDRPSGGACGFYSLDALRTFALSEATTIGRPLPVRSRLALELAIRALYPALTTLCAAIEAPAS